MLNNKIVFARFMALLKSIDPDVPLPAELEDYLWKNMIVEALCNKACRIEEENKIPKKAYYVVRGFVLVYGYNHEQDRYLFRIYRANSIVAMDCFMRQQTSPYCIWLCKDTLLWSISSTCMDAVYKNWDGMKAFAFKTSSKHNAAKEQSRASLLGIEDIETRILEFYKRYKGLLPPKKSPIRDTCIACFLDTTKSILKRNRRNLKNKGLLKY
ncbi:CRP-like cAMP-binding protein [Pedobacter sp. AK017]|uniref:Crp/Fnr family transcriptional regulator n=1 Tax=Pedobacter sp. AK017 TaxID=2723073 RepID=UPI00160CF7EB|nr:Crp/Fnr family transcriptional regulator [Pedobacter sp. AK017]MBB5437347.1 CRP-like cAMP-binding protein [Pedobacter sp. AK017]